MSVEPESAHALTGAFVLDALDADEHEAFQAHLTVCEDCRDEVASLRLAADRLPGLSATAPPADLRDRVLGAIATVRPLPPLPQPESVTPARGIQQTPASQAPSAPEPSREPVNDELATRRARRALRRGGEARWRLVAAAAVVVAVGGVWWGAAGPSLQPTPRETVAVEQQDADLVALLQAPDLVVASGLEDTGVEGTVFRSESEGRAAMVARDLPDLPADAVFQAWNLVDATPTSAGTFTATDGAATVLLSGDVTAAQVMAVTIEPVGGSDTPTSDILLQVSMPDA